MNTVVLVPISVILNRILCFVNNSPRPTPETLVLHSLHVYFFTFNFKELCHSTNTSYIPPAGNVLYVKSSAQPRQFIKEKGEDAALDRVINRLIMWRVPASPLSISAKSAAVISLPLIECDSELC